jgi:hypothetical protein
MSEHRIAMWSGPRNISTAMMRSWGNRPDTFVCDEPLYAHYLLAKGITNHPGYQVTIAQHENDWRKVVDWLTGPIPEGKSIFYQKHMAHHVLPGMSLDWIDELTNCLLIREPREMLTSLLEFLPEPKLEDTGLPHQLWLFEHFRKTRGSTPPILDARDVLTNPAKILRRLCEVVGVEFLPCMLSWDRGIRPTDGAWAPFWYDKVAETTSFGAYRPKDEQVPEKFLPLLAECEAIYQRLYEFRLT